MTAEVVDVLMFDDSPDDVSIVSRLLAHSEQGRFVIRSADSAEQCLTQLEDNKIDLLFLDFAMPAEDGISFMTRAAAVMDLPAVIILTGQNNPHIAVEAIKSGASDCIYKGEMTSESLGRAAHDAVAKFHDRAELARFDGNIIESFVRASALVDPTTGGERLAELAVRFGRALSLDAHQIDILRCGALLHDVGKLGVRNELICKPSSLTAEELSEVRQHPLIGERLCAALSVSREIGPIIRHHHERWDGQGYTDGLAKDEIPLLARVISLVDSFDAMTVDRPYRRALPLSEALRRLRKGAGSQWDPDMVAVFLELINEQKGSKRRANFWR